MWVQGVWVGLEMKLCFIRHTWTKDFRQIIFEFLVQMSKFGSWVAGWVLTIKSKYFIDFFEIS